MDDLIRYLQILPAGQAYSLKSPTYGDISPYDEVKIFRQLFLFSTTKQARVFVDIYCDPLYT